MWHLPGYEIGDVLSKNQNIIVFRAIRLKDRLPVILKATNKEYPSPRDLAKLDMEFEITRQFDHPGLVRGLELFPFKSGKVLVLEDFGGVSLRNYLGRQTFGVNEFLQVAIKIAETLSQIHLFGIIHKDIKPSNIIYNPETGRVSIVDFSISSRLSREKQKLVGVSVLEGSLPYISPEQTGRMNRPIDYRTDFYSLGISFYEMLSGRLPFSSENPMEMVHFHLARHPEPLTQLHPTIPPMLSNIVQRLLEKNAEERYQSAMGLAADLRRCAESLALMGYISIFELGEHDSRGHFQIPQKLYGREREIAEMLEIFEIVCDGSAELVLVAGYSGVGKTALIEEIHKPIAKRNGYFISSKFDQYRRDIPYLAISEAFRGLIQQLMTESEAAILQWQQQLLAVLDNMGQVIIDVIPEVQLFLGEQPPVVSLEGPEAQNRFIAVFEKFLGVFTTKNHPLVFFLDDLQWADHASLKLLEDLMERKDSHHLLVLGAYRDNEVQPSHPLMLTLDNIQKRRPIQTIVLSPLNAEHVSLLLCDTLHTTPDEVATLLHLVFTKTQGNPFFLNQLLLSLHESKLIQYDFAYRTWRWELAKIQEAGVSEHVVDLMSNKIRRLTPETQHLLKLASCLGNSFSLSTLATISGQDQHQTAVDLFPAIQESLVLTMDDSFKYFIGGDHLQGQGEGIHFKFLHDRVHEAAYVLMTVEDQKEVHLRIGRTLLANLAPNQLEDHIFDVVNHFNLGIGFVTERQDRENLAQLNLLAGKKARSNTAHYAARDYFSRGIQLMGQDAWKDHYETMFQLHRNLSECEYLCANMPRAEALFAVTLEQAKNSQDKANLYELMMNAFMKFGRFLEGVELGRRALSMYGVSLPEHSSDFQTALNAEFAEIRERIAGRSLDELLEIPNNPDEELAICMSLLHQVWNNSYFAEGLYDLGTIAALRIATLSLTKGHTKYSSFGYVTYGLNLSSVFGDYDNGYDYGLLAVRLLKKTDNIHLVAKINNLFGHFISHYKRHFNYSIPHYEESYRACLQTGDLWYGLWAVNFIPHVKFIKGDPLDDVYREAKKYHDYAANSGNEMMFQLLNMDEHMVLNLQNKLEDRNSFNSYEYNEASMTAMLKAIPFDFGLFWYDLYKSFVYYLNEEYEMALEHSLAAEKNKGTAPGLMLFVEQHFYHGLILAANLEGVEDEERDRRIGAINHCLERLYKWNLHGPDNYRHKYLLVLAETERLKGQELAAIEYYEQAAEDALRTGAIQNAAIANELAGKLMLASGHKRAARGYLTEAHYLYERWGANRKVFEFEQKYGSFLLRTSGQHRVHVDGTTTTSGDMLDLMTVLKASLALSGEIVLSELLRKMLGILIENAGAVKGSLLIERNDEWVVVASGDMMSIHVGEPLAYRKSKNLSAVVVNYVLKTQKNLVLVNASEHPTFSNDAYIKSHKIKSLLCIPILHHNRFNALLYLENSLVTGAFNTDRLAILQMLSLQASISLENAQLYANLEQHTQRLEYMVAERTSELQEKNNQLEAKTQEILRTQQQLVTQEKMASLGTLTAGVAHEINNPTNFVSGSTQNLVRDLKKFEEFLLELAGEDADPDVLNAIRKQMSPLLVHTQIILNGTERIRSIVRDLQSFSRLSEAETKRIELITGISSTVSLVRANFQDAVTFQTHFQDPIEMECHPAEMNQVFMNLIVNACHAIFKQHGRVTDGSGVLRIESFRIENQGFISFSDNGCGIPEEAMEKIFEPFYTTKPVGEGTGLGLSISYGIVKRHGGEIRVQSTEGKGTVFTLILPLDRIS